MAETATQRIAARLAAQQAAAPAKGKATKATAAVEDDEDDEDDEDEAVVEPKKKMTLKERQAARRAAKSGKPAAKPAVINLEAEADEDESDDDEDDEEEEEVVVAKPKAKATAKGKKPASPAQIAAREKFAAASRARAAASAKAKGKAAKTPVQTPAQVRAKQSADRAAARKAAEQEAETKRRRVGTSKSKAAAKPSKPIIAITSGSAEARARDSRVKGGKAAAVSKAKSKAPTRERSDGTREKVHALLAKGKTRAEIMEALDLTYASVFYHAKSYEGDVATARGRIFVKTKLDEDGEPLGKGKTEDVSRSEAMRRAYLSGEEVSDIAREFDVRYQLAYTAIRPLMGEVDE